MCKSKCNMIFATSLQLTKKLKIHLPPHLHNLFLPAIYITTVTVHKHNTSHQVF